MTRGRALRLALALLVAMSVTTARCQAAGWSNMLLLPTHDIIVVGSAGGDVNAFDLKDGQRVWRHAVEVPASVILDLHGDEVLLLHQSGLQLAKVAKRDPLLTLEGIDARTGSTRWTYVTRGSLDGKPIIREDRLFLSLKTVAAPSGHLVAVDLKGGAEVWRVDADVLRLRAEGDRLYAAQPSPEGVVITAYEATSGKVAWTSVPLKGDYKSGPDLVGGTALVATKTAESGGGTALHFYGITQGRPAYALDFPDKTYDEVKLQGLYVVARSNEGKTLHVYDAQGGLSRWVVSPAQAAGPKGECVSPTIDGETLFTVATAPPDRATLLALDIHDGHEIAHADLQGQPESAITVLGDKLLVGVKGKRHGDDAAEAGHDLACFSSRELKPMWTFPLDAALGDSPVTDIAGPRGPMLLVQTDTSLIGLDPRSGEKVFKTDVDIAAGPVVHGPLVAYGDNNLSFVIVDMNAPDKPRAVVNTKAWFSKERLPNLLFVCVIVGLILWFIAHARRNTNLFIRRLAGLNALDEAVGRATEMGKPVLYVCGTQDVDEIETLAGLSILGHVARRAAEYETPLLVPASRSVVMSTAQEVVREAHFKAGRPDSYQQDNIRYLTDDQFGFVAGVDGIMVREKPAANFYMGMFFGESLILAETGHATGAIQIAGTAQAAQLPFFVAACDYTLMGEELFAASAYLSRDPREVGSLKGQDYAKAIIMLVILFASIAYPWWPQVKTWLTQ